VNGSFGIQIWLSALVAGVFVSSCTVGPNYSPPRVKVEPAFGELGQTTSAAPNSQPSRTTGQTAVVTEWWRSFKDEQLNRLIEAAARQNDNLQVATTRIRQARAQRGITAADLFPNVGANVGYTHAYGSKNLGLLSGGNSGGSSGGSASGSSTSGGTASKRGAGSATKQAPGPSSTGGGLAPAPGALSPFGSGGLPGVTSDLYQLGFDANWELDVFGGQRRRLEAATADLAAAVESQRDVMVTLLAEVARNYLELRGTQERLAVARDNLKAQQRILELTESMYKAGLANQLDVTRAAGQVATTTATIPPLEAQVRQAIHALSTLVGQEPNALSAELSEAAPLPPVPPQVPVGLPSELLRRRPDIRRAERQIAAATARIGSAKADLFPKFAITGSVGLDSSSFSHLFDWQSRYFLASPTVSWPVFEAGRIRSNIALQRANQQEALLQYHNSILSALREVEDALANYTTQQGRRTALLEALRQSRETLNLASDQYRNGLTDFLVVLDAQRNVLTVQDALAQSNQSIATNLVALYKALGGGWPPEVSHPAK
jgi:outer membrane protein, multidrug efflux system